MSDDRHLPGDQGSLARRQIGREPRRGLRVADARRVFDELEEIHDVGQLHLRQARGPRLVIVHRGDRPLVMGERECGVELEGRLERRLRRLRVELVQGLHAGDVLLVGVGARRADRPDVGVGRRHGEDFARELAEQRHDRVGDRGLLPRRPNLLAVANVEDGGRHRRAAAHLQHVADHEVSRARALGDRDAVIEGQLRPRGPRQLAHEVRDPPVVDDVDVLPARQVHRQQIHARVAQPLGVRRARDVVERQDDPRLVVERRIDPLRDAVSGAARRVSHGGGVPSGHCAATALVATRDRARPA